MRPALDDEAFWKQAAEVLNTGLKLKKIMLKRGMVRCRELIRQLRDLTLEELRLTT